MSKLYNGLEGLEALHIDLRSGSPWPEALKNARVKKISSLLQSLRTRENFLLTFTVNGESVTSDLGDTPEGVVTEEPVVPPVEEGNSGDGTLDRSLEPVGANW